jgi:hydroxymethylpyrimidine kinase/phosphomethylpyrimidine kinase
MVSKSGSQLLPKDAVQTLREELLKFTTVFTPNIPEAKLLLQDAGQTVAEPESLEDIVDIAKRIHALGPRYVLVKGGHLPLHKDRFDLSREHGRQIVVNVLYGNGETILIETDYINTKNTHGTGCSLACKCRTLL